MKNELFSLLQKFNSHDLNKLQDFLNNPQYSHNKNLKIFYKYLLKYYPKFVITKNEQKDIFAKVYGDKKYNDSTYRSLSHLLRTRIEDFLVVEQSLGDQNIKTFSLLKYYYEKNIDGSFEKSIRKKENELVKNLSAFSAEDLLYKYQIEVLRYNFRKINTNNLHNRNIVTKSTSISSSGVTLTLHYFIETVSDYVIQAALMNSFENIHLAIDIDSIFHLDKLETMFTEKNDRKSFLLYLNLFKLFSKPENEEYYIEYKKSVEDNYIKLKLSDASFHYSCLVTYCIIKKNQGYVEKYQNELWDLYKLILEKKLYANTKNKYLDISLYRAILFLGLKLKLFEEVKRFIDEYYSIVSPKEIKNIQNLSYAYYHYEMGNFEKALNFAKYIKLSDFVFKYDVKNLLIKLYYELKYWDSLESVIHSYREFLRNDLILSSNNKLKLQNFLNNVEKLLKLLNRKDKLECEYLKAELIKTENVYAKEWLFEKYSSFY